MGWNGSGVFQRLYSWVADAAAGIDISSSRMDADTNNITVNGFGNTLTRDGQGSATANLPMNGFRHTGAGIAVSNNDYVILAQLNGGLPIAGVFSSVNILTGGLTIAAGGMTIVGTMQLAGAVILTGSMSATGSISAASFSTAGVINGGSLGVTGAISGASETITGLMQAGTVVATGAISGASGSITGSLSAGTLGVSGNIVAASGAITDLTVGLANGPTKAPQWGQVFAGNSSAWNDMTGSRGFGTTYTNALSKPIAISVTGTSSATAQIAATVAGAVNAAGTFGTTGVNLGIVTMVPAGATYSVTLTAGTPALTKWLELD